VKGAEIAFGAAFTSPEDQFNRKIALSISEGRLKKRPTFFRATRVPATHEEVRKAILGHILTNEVPGRPSRWMYMSFKENS